MTAPVPGPRDARVVERHELGEQLVRLELDCPGFVSTGISDEWVALTVPGQYQNRYYTVRRRDGDQLTIDVVLHEEGLVTEWAALDVVGDVVGLSPAKGSFEPPADATWIMLVGDLTGAPAMARIAEEWSDRVPVTGWCEADPVADYFPDGIDWIAAPADGSRLAEFVAALPWPEGPGYFWMAGESAQMREIRRHLRRDRGLPTSAYDVMGYWSGSRGRQRRAVDPGPIYARGRALGKSDEEIWADFDAAREGER